METSEKNMKIRCLVVSAAMVGWLFTPNHIKDLGSRVTDASALKYHKAAVVIKPYVAEVPPEADVVVRDPEAHGIERVFGCKHLAPENPHNRRWNAVADGKEFAPTTTRTKITTIVKLP